MLNLQDVLSSSSCETAGDSIVEIEEYKKNITGKYFDLTKELLVKSGYCTKEDGITSPSIIYSKNQDSNKLKIDFVFDILRENQNERVEINNILTSVNLIKIKEKNNVSR